MTQAHDEREPLQRGGPVAKLRRLADSYVDALLELEPLWASELGLPSVER